MKSGSDSPTSIHQNHPSENRAITGGLLHQNNVADLSLYSAVLIMLFQLGLMSPQVTPPNESRDFHKLGRSPFVRCSLAHSNLKAMRTAPIETNSLSSA
jgi:hypothetical protein